MIKCLKYLLNNLVNFLLFLLTYIPLFSFCQSSSDQECYYIFPIKPDQKNTLAGTMGELRSTHFHTGIDIRTEGKIGLPVYAAASGYISRISVSSYGFGNTLYISHPNGQTTVYAHLKGFNYLIADYVRRYQYQKKSFKLNISLVYNQLKINQGDVIGYSGNSGSSGGPHLHFDIRDKNHNSINPLSFGFSEIKDNTPPIIKSIIIKTLDVDSRIEGEFGQKQFYLNHLADDYYTINQTIKAEGLIGIMVDAYDKLDYSRFRCGINTIKVKVNNELLFQQHIDKLIFSKQKHIFRHMSYEDLINNNKKFHKLYVEDGNELDFYFFNQKKGKINVKNNSVYDVEIVFIDSYGNKSYVFFKIEGTSSLVPPKFLSQPYFKIVDNTYLMAFPKQLNVNKITIDNTTKLPAYSSSTEDIYLVDLREKIPKIIQFNDQNYKTGILIMIPPNKEFRYYGKNYRLKFSKQSLFDSLYLTSEYEYNQFSKKEIWKFGKNTNPLKAKIDIQLEPTAYYNKIKTSAYYLTKSETFLFIGGIWNGNKIHFKTNKLGAFTLLSDTEPPKIIPIKINKNTLRFVIKDNLSGIKDFNCFVNDVWVLMNYDYKKNIIWSEKLDFEQGFEKKIELIVTDNVDNQKTFITYIN